MMKRMNYVVMGIDRIGKNTFIQKCLPGYKEIHLSKPPADVDPLTWTKAEYADYFMTLKNSEGLVYNRGHIDEFVYGPIYRKVPTYWLKIYEQEVKDDLDNTCFVLLLSKNFSVMQDDGQSLDYSRREEEQNLFIKHFDESPFKHKVKIYTIDEYGYRSPNDIQADFFAAKHPKCTVTVDLSAMPRAAAVAKLQELREIYGEQLDKVLDKNDLAK